MDTNIKLVLITLFSLLMTETVHASSSIYHNYVGTVYLAQCPDVGNQESMRNYIFLETDGTDPTTPNHYNGFFEDTTFPDFVAKVKGAHPDWHWETFRPSVTNDVKGIVPSYEINVGGVYTEGIVGPFLNTRSVTTEGCLQSQRVVLILTFNQIN